MSVMDNISREKIITLLDYWIGSEMLDTESMDEKEILNIKKDDGEVYAENILKTGTEKITEKLLSSFDAHVTKPEDFKAKYGKDKDNEDFVCNIVFGHINRKIFTEYFYKKVGDNGLNKCDFDEKEYISYSSYSYRYVEKKDKIYYGFDISPLFIALKTKGADLNLNSYERLKNDYWIKNGINTLEFAQIPEGLFRAFAERMEELSKDVRKTFGEEELSDEDFAAFRRELFRVYIRVKSIKSDVSDSNLKDSGLGLESKFFISDLEMLRQWIANDEKFGDKPYEENLAGLILSMCEPSDINRVNISPSTSEREKLIKLFDESLNAAKAPVGKWAGGRRPYLYQQLAINLYRNDATPIFSVNDPPGTGKTTLLQEIIADTITRKATRISEILTECDYDKDRIFEEDLSEYFLKKEYSDLFDYGILIASGNNEAVENITKELPEKLSEPYKKIKKALLDEVRSENPGLFKEEDLYGYFTLPITATLGRKGNLEQYKKKKVITEFTSFTGKKEESDACIRALNGLFIKKYEEVLKKQKELSDSDGIDRENLWNEYFEKGESYEKDASDTGAAQKYAEIQKINPGTDEEFDRLREELFICAWMLHQMFAWHFSGIAKTFKTTLETIYEGRVFDTDDPWLKRCYYNVLFFVSPVISSTFASVRRTFKGLNVPESLGMLLVDEAGQVKVKDALGALLRSQKAIIVGDPKQIPPVVSTSEEFALNFLCPDIYREQYKKRLKDTGYDASLQEYADAVNPYGSKLGDSWVGCPLVLHSRCNSPMFEISNALSYNNTMINLSATCESRGKSGDEFILDDSYWIQIKGREGGGEKNHFVKRQAEAVLKMILEKCEKMLKTPGFDAEGGELGLFVITPFTSVATGLKNYIKTYVNIRSRESKENGVKDDKIPVLKKWAAGKIGTVHTFQGKETDEVILLLGCDSFSKKSAEWVYTNIVNVAASRARYRFYIVGDAELFRFKRGAKEESPVNIARRILNRTCGDDKRLGLNDLNIRLANTPYLKLSTGREKEEFICPVCKSAVIKGANGWFCVGKNYGRCDMSFNIYDSKLDSISIKRLLSGSETWFDTHNGLNRIYHVYPEIVTDKTANGTYRRFKFDADGDVKEGKAGFIKLTDEEFNHYWSEDENTLPVFLLCNCSKLMQQHRKSHERNNTNIEDYFDIMVLDAVYTLSKFKSETAGKDTFTFNSTDIMKILSGNRNPDLKSGLRDEIEKRLKKLTERSYYKSRAKEEKRNEEKPILSNVTVSEKNRHLYRMNLKEEGSFLFDFLDNYEEKQAVRNVLRIPIEYLNPVYTNPPFEGGEYKDVSGRAMFPMSLKWVMIKYYILYRIAYMYRVRTTSNLISFANMDEALGLSENDNKKEITRMEKKRFYGKIDDYLKYLKGKKYILDYRIHKDSKEPSYCGISKIEILNTVKIDRDTGETIRYE